MTIRLHLGANRGRLKFSGRSLAIRRILVRPGRPPSLPGFSFLRRLLYGHKSGIERHNPLTFQSFVRTFVAWMQRWDGPQKDGVTKGNRVELRVDADEVEAWDQAAKRAKLSRSDWVRLTLNSALRR